MDQNIIKFGDTEIEKQNFHQHKSTILINNLDINRILVYDKIFFIKNSFKCFIGYKDAKKLDLYAFLFQKISTCKRDFDEIKYMSFLIKDDELLEKYNYI